MCKTVAMLQLVVLLSAVLGRGSPRDPDSCEKLAIKYASRYYVAVNEGRTRPPKLTVWDEDKGSPAAAAAALMNVALRYGLGYDATLRLEHFDVCNANVSQFVGAVAPAVYFKSCNGSVRNLLELSLDVARVPLREPLLLHCVSAAGKTNLPLEALRIVHDKTTLTFCASNMTLSNFKQMKPELPPCNFSEHRCPTAEEQNSRVVLHAARTPEDKRAADVLRKYFCDNNSSLTFLRFDNTTCFRQTLQHLDRANVSFLFLDKDWMHKPGLLSLDNNRNEAYRCPARSLNEITRFVYSIGDGKNMQDYAPQVANFVKRFCPPLEHLKNMSIEEPYDDFGMKSAACQWALNNNDIFESWISNEKGEYELYLFLCANDILEQEYIRIIDILNTSIKHDFGLNIIIRHVYCHDRKNMQETLLGMMKYRPLSAIGAIAWSSSEGIPSIAATANLEQMPLILVGPVPPGTSTGPAVNAIHGKLEDLARVYRNFLQNCGWTRFAVLSDETTYAKGFKESLFLGNGFLLNEKTVNAKTIIDTLKSLKADEARVFIVNTNSSMAAEILLSALKLRMTPPMYAWIVREWSPGAKSATQDWGDMSHISLGTAWRGFTPKSDVGSSQGNATLRERLQLLWPGAAWPALAAPLVDAILLHSYSFFIFERLYSKTSYVMRQHDHNDDYVMSFSQINDRITLPGVARNLSFYNGTVTVVTVYLERWRGATVSVLASWELRDSRAGGMCDVSVQDRPACMFPAAGNTFVRRCYDVPVYSLFVVLALLPIVFAVARRARLRRLVIRDLNLQAQILESKRLAPVVHGDSLCMHKKIGTGHFASVYLATLQQSVERTILVAAKELRDNSDKEEYLQEAGILQKLDHENVVKFVGVCVSNGSLLILMEYAFHGDLLQYLQARRHLLGQRQQGQQERGEAKHVSAAALTRLAREAATALQYLAQRGLIHRDVRAANCLLDEHRTLKLADFGLARQLGENLEYTSIRRAVFPVLWMAPESLAGGTFSAASDVWALGVLCLELVTLGGRPYGESSPQRVLAYVRHGGRPPLPPDTCEQTRSLLMACWHHNAAARASARDMVHYLTRQPDALRPALQPAPNMPDLPDTLPALKISDTLGTSDTKIT